MKKYLLLIFLAFTFIARAQSDCISAIGICGNSQLSYTPSGYGDIFEDLGGCMSTDERYTVWYTFTVANAGTLGFTITPNNLTDDYDFAVYGPNKTCDTRGEPIRCNYSGLSGQTGLSLTVIHPATSAQWSGFINAAAGDTYYLVIDNFSKSSNGFTLQWTGTATLKSPFSDPAIQPYPLIQPGNNGVVTLCGLPSQFDFSTLSAGIVNNNPNFYVTYHFNTNDLLSNTSPISGPITVNATTTYYYAVRYSDPANPNNAANKCFQNGTVKFIDGSITATDATLSACSNNNTGTATYDLTTATTISGANISKKYYPTLADANAGTNEITIPMAYTSPPATVYVKATNTATGCNTTAKITLNFNAVVTVNDNVSLTQCFLPTNPSNGIFNLTTAGITSLTGVTKKYYPSQTDAENQTNEITNATAYNAPSGVVYVRVTNSLGCWNVGKITLNVTAPSPSATLKDVVICTEDTTTLDAGSGYTSYLWSTGATTRTITNVGVGTYTVALKKGECTTIQTVHVYPAEKPEIAKVEVGEKTITVTPYGGKPPYQYSIDNIHWQDSNVFTDLPRGQTTVYLKDSYDCEPAVTIVTVPNLVNFISPNNDGINDYIDYSDLAYKGDVTFTVFDRYGSTIFIANKDNKYKWDGKLNGKNLPTGNYWYVLTWTENDAKKTPVKYSGWIVIKNR